MKLLDKLKNTFFEEEYVEVEEKPKKNNQPAPAPKKEEKINEVKEEIRVEPPREVKIHTVDETKEVEEKKVDTEPAKVNSFSYFEEEDFFDYDDYKKPEKEPTPIKHEEPKKIYDNPVYGSKKIQTSSPSPYTKETKQGFTPTPIISPIYGILDKNYTKDEIIDKKEVKPSSSYVSRKNVDLDSIREKAFGTTLQHDFDLNEEEPKVVEIEEDIDDNLLYDMTDLDKTPSVEKVTLQDAEEYFQDLGLEYNVDYKDAKYEKATGRRVNRTPKIEDFDNDDVTLPIDEEDDDSSINVEKEPEIKEDKEDISLEDNLFDLIDSMYEEKE